MAPEASFRGHPPDPALERGGALTSTTMVSPQRPIPSRIRHRTRPAANLAGNATVVLDPEKPDGTHTVFRPTEPKEETHHSHKD